MPLQNDKSCVITGANSGLGYWTSLSLAEKGMHVYMVCRSKEKGEQALKNIINQTGNKKISLIIADLSSLKSIYNACQTIRSQSSKINILINNAALVSSKRKLTEDGIELQFAVNHIAPFYITHLLLPVLMKSNDGRIINISSNSHRIAKINFNDINLLKNYHILKAYAQSKLANVLFTYELDNKIKTKKINNLSTYCIDPGHNNTPIGLKNTNFLHNLAWWIRSKMGKDPRLGVISQIHVATINDAKKYSGLYWKNSKPITSSFRSYSEQNALKLWELSMKYCHIEDYFKTW